MKITFFRQGFANNSSSSHSIIFTSKDLLDQDSDTNEFGWDDFVASAPRTKYIYFLICLFDSWRYCVELESNSAMVDESDLEDMKFKLFSDWLVKNKIGKKKSLSKKEVQELQHLITTGYVDHQSHFTFPVSRNPDEGLNVDFVKFFFDEISKNEYIILGGNDNSDGGHSLSGLDEDGGQVIKTLYKNFCEDTPKNNICVYDNKTKEFVISNSRSGNLLKIEAELV